MPNKGSGFSSLPRSHTKKPLPSEIVEFIFELLCHDYDTTSNQAALSALRVCSQWHRAGSRVIWRDMVLGPKSLARLCDSSPTAAHLAFVQSLTIVWPAIEYTENDIRHTLQRHPEFHGEYDLWKDLLKSLPAITRYMEHLTTFSFVMKDMVSNNVVESKWLSAYDLVEVINSLPESLRNLEVDTSDTDVHNEPDQPSHLCEAIARRMSQLEHARLRLPWFCPNILAPSPLLETLVFPLREESKPRRKKPCQHCQHQNSEGGREYNKTGKIARQTFITKLKEHLPEWPKLQKLLVVSNEFHLLKPGLCTRDLMCDETALNYLFWYWEDHVAYMDEKWHFMRYRDADGLGQDLLGRTEEYDELLEGPSWGTTSRGSRFPGAYKESPAGKKRSWVKHGESLASS